MPGYLEISRALAEWSGSFLAFIKQLDKNEVPYLSYSKISSVESCEYRYFLEYVEGIKVREPLYFKKGTIFHQAANMAHRQLAKGKLNCKPIERLVDKHFESEDNRHLRNAVELLIQNAHTGFEVVATERPFVLSLGRGLPPLIGIIDLLLSKDDVFLVVDHKTGKNLKEQDGLQLHLYREYVRRTFKPKRLLACFDEYRWVNNLQRIRVPAFRRTHVSCTSKSWTKSLERIHVGYKTIRRIERTGNANSGYICYACHLSGVCDRASVGWSW